MNPLLTSYRVTTLEASLEALKAKLAAALAERDLLEQERDAALLEIDRLRGEAT